MSLKWRIFLSDKKIFLKNPRPNECLRIEPKKPIGRPQKYAHVLLALFDHDLYTPATIANFAISKGFVENTSLGRQRIRITLSRLSKSHNFPWKGDGYVKLGRQCWVPAWYGHRWKEAAKGFIKCPRQAGGETTT